MKNKKVKVALVIALLCIVIGAVMGVGGMSALGWDWQKLDTRVYEEKFYEATDAINAVELDATDCPIQIVKGDKVSLKYYAEKDDKFTIDVIETATDSPDKTVKTLKISNNSKGKWNFNFFNFKTYKFILTVPDDISVKVDGVGCELEADVLKLNALVIDATNVRITAKELSARSVNINATNINITTKKIVALEKIKLNSTNIDFDVNSLDAPKLDINSTSVTFKSSDNEANKFISSDIKFEFTNFKTVTNIIIVGKKADYNIAVSLVNGAPLSNSSGASANKIAINGVNFSGSISFSE